MSGPINVGSPDSATLNQVATAEPIRSAPGPQRRMDVGGPPPPPASLPPADSGPVLPPPSGSDNSGVLAAFLALKTKISDEQERDSEKDLQAQGMQRKQDDQAVSKQMGDAIQKQEEARKKQAIMKVFGWILTALAAIVSIVAAVVTGGALAIAGAALTTAVAVTMQTLQQTGVIDKMQQAIADSLLKDHPDWGKQKAQEWAMALTMGITIAVSLATLASGAGIANLASSAAQTAERASMAAVKIAMMVQKAALGAEVAGTVTQAGVSISAGVDSYDAAQDEANALEIKKMIAKLQQQSQDETDRLQQMVLEMQDITTRVMQTVRGQAETTQTISSNMTQATV